ncbi:hypothetical protein ISCGN_010910 [Ixodes scapularis]
MSAYRVAEAAIDDRTELLGELGQFIWKNPELGFEETKAHDYITTYLESEGFQVTRNYILPTAFRAEFGATKYRRILKAALDDPFRAARDIRDALELEISDTTVRRCLYDAGLHSRVACQLPLLTERHKQLRLDFAHFLENWTVEDWTHVIFSDDSTFCTPLDQRRRVWRPGNFWIDGRMTWEVYSDILDHVLMLFVLDGPFPEDRGPSVAILCEYDALPGIGHACGHNLIAEGSVAVAVGVKAVLASGESSHVGKLVVLGTPAEENGSGKQLLIDKGAFRDLDVAVMVHPASMSILRFMSIALVRMLVGQLHSRAGYGYSCLFVLAENRPPCTSAQS